MNVVDPPAAVAGAGVPVTVMSEEPGGVAVVTVIVNRSVAPARTGVTVGVAKPDVAPAGSPVAESVTGLVRPFTRVAVTVTAHEPVVPVLQPAAGALFDSV